MVACTLPLQAGQKSVSKHDQISILAIEHKFGDRRKTLPQTNIFVVEKFLGKIFEVDEKERIIKLFKRT